MLVRMRLRAPAVAALAVAITLAGAPTSALAKDPPGLGRFMNAIGSVESGGRYTARNASSGAYGKYQILPSNWPAWARRFLGNAHAPQTPRNQERVARAKFIELYRSVHAWRRVAYWWLTGSGQRTGWSPMARSYVARVMARYRTASTTVPTGAGSSGSTGSHPSTTLRLSERSSTIHYVGTWRPAAHAGYTGDHVAYATRAGATATVTFTGRSITWYGPLGPTRGQARVIVDGVAIRTVDLERPSFTAHAALFTTRWSIAGRHTLTIEVLGTARHPMVAIDEFVVGR